MKLSDCPHLAIVKIGTTTYRLYRLEEFPNGQTGTMKRFARLQPCNLRQTGWWEDHKQQSLIRNWSESCELVETP